MNQIFIPLFVACTALFGITWFATKIKLLRLIPVALIFGIALAAVFGLFK